ncbi:MAG TPA: SGNH/GDSL hydrolase family protein [Terracidiphilus sp.]|nr:SGNH/GDSL hydrolase family protein [Terracidiphilus sp.]
MKLRTAFFATALAALLAPAMLLAQATGTPPDTKAPAPACACAPATLPSGHPNNEYWRQHDQQLLSDFPWLAHFKEDNLKLGPPAPGENRVVFMGDSITQGWHLENSFPGKPYVNRGISGQTTPQMVLRFHQDVVDLHPKAVIILAGINDIAENTGPMTLQQTEDNLAAMAEMGAANHIQVILCSVTPAFDFPWHPGLAPAPKVVTLNQWIKAYAAQNHLIYVDYYSAMTDSRGGLPPTLSKDGVHPLPAGYAIMAPLAEAAIEKALTAANSN